MQAWRSFLERQIVELMAVCAAAVVEMLPFRLLCRKRRAMAARGAEAGENCDSCTQNNPAAQKLDDPFSMLNGNGKTPPLIFSIAADTARSSQRLRCLVCAEAGILIFNLSE